MTDDFRNTLSEVYDRLTASEEKSEEIARDERGRFKGQEATNEELPAVEPAPAEETSDQGNEPPAEPQEEPLSPPDRWSAEWKSKFTALPREAQQVLLEREGEYDKGFTQKSQEAANYKRQYEPLEQVIAPRRQALMSQYGSESAGLAELFRLSDYASQDPVGFIQWFAQQRGVSLGSPPQKGEEQTDPLAPIKNEIYALKNQLQAETQGKIAREIEAFKQSHEHFEDVRLEMSALMQSGRAQDLQSAYEMATWANPSVREKLLTAQKAKLEEERQAEAAKRAQEQAQAAAKARKTAGTQISGKAPLATASAAPTSMRESMEKAWNRINGA